MTPRNPAAGGLARRREFADFTGAPQWEVSHGPRRWAGALLRPLGSAICARTDDRVAALTYDDGPHPERTPRILDALAGSGVRATFYVLTDQAQAHPGVLARIVAEGHEVALHGIDHTRLSALGAREAVSRLKAAKRRLEDLTGRPVTTYRPTYGAQTPAQYLGARALGLDVVIWSGWAGDWFEDDVDAVAERALAACHPGGVLLLHDTTDDTDEKTLPRPTYDRGDLTRRVLAGLDARGYALMPVGELFARYPVARALWFERRAAG